MSRSIEDLEQEAAGFNDEPPEPWKPSVGEYVVGTVISIDIRSTKHDEEVPVLVLETADRRRVAVWALWTVLRNELKRVGVQVGDVISIRRLKDADKGYRRYHVFTPKEQAREFSWDSVNVDGGDVAPDDQEALVGGNSGSDSPVSEPDDNLPF